MVKDQHAKALDFMVNMKFSDSCIGFAAEKSNAAVLHNFSMKISHQVMPRILYQHFICSSIEWHQRWWRWRDDERKRHWLLEAFLHDHNCNTLFFTFNWERISLLWPKQCILPSNNM